MEPTAQFSEHANEGHWSVSRLTSSPTHSLASHWNLGTKVLKERDIVFLCLLTLFTIEGNYTVAVEWRDRGPGAWCHSQVHSN